MILMCQALFWDRYICREHRQQNRTKHQKLKKKSFYIRNLHQLKIFSHFLFLVGNQVFISTSTYIPFISLVFSIHSLPALVQVFIISRIPITFQLVFLPPGYLAIHYQNTRQVTLKCKSFRTFSCIKICQWISIPTEGMSCLYISSNQVQRTDTDQVKVRIM